MTKELELNALKTTVAVSFIISAISLYKPKKVKKTLWVNQK